MFEPTRIAGDLETSDDRRTTHSLWRYGAPSLLLGIFVIFGALYLSATTIYFDAMRVWGIDAFRFPFLDMHAILSALECKRQGIDVMASNPCDVLHRPHVYSPLWLVAASLPVNNRWLVPCGLALDLLFILSLYRLPAATRGAEAAIFALALLSPATAYALERANNDLLIFLIVMIIVPVVIASWPQRASGYILILLAGLLKYYPLTLLILAVREAPKKLVIISGAALITLVAFYLFYSRELAENAVLIQAFDISYHTDQFDVRNLPFGIAELMAPYVHSIGFNPNALAVVFFAILFLDLVSRARRIAQNSELAGGFVALSSRKGLLLVIGAVLITGCFFAGHSILYRAIFFLFTLPGLLELARTAQERFVRIWLWQGICLIIFLMWSEFFRVNIDAIVTMLPQGRITIGLPLVFWAIKELMWWRVIALFCGVLGAYLATSASVQLVLQRLPWLKFVSMR